MLEARESEKEQERLRQSRKLTRILLVAALLLAGGIVCVPKRHADASNKAADPGGWMAKAEHGWNHSYAFTTQDFHDPIEVKPKSFKDLQRNCIRCHGEITSEIADHKNLTDQDPINCIRCHSNVGHRARGPF